MKIVHRQQIPEAIAAEWNGGLRPIDRLVILLETPNPQGYVFTYSGLAYTDVAYYGRKDGGIFATVKEAIEAASDGEKETWEYQGNAFAEWYDADILEAEPQDELPLLA